MIATTIKLNRTFKVLLLILILLMFVVYNSSLHLPAPNVNHLLSCGGSQYIKKQALRILNRYSHIVDTLKQKTNAKSVQESLRLL
jgi:hypothetical protein